MYPQNYLLGRESHEGSRRHSRSGTDVLRPSQKRFLVRVAVAVLVATLVSPLGGTAVGEELWGRPSSAEFAGARELQNAYRSGSTKVFPPIDPGAPCPEDVEQGDSWVRVYRIRRGCLWSQRAHDEWRLDDYEPDVEKYFDSDPFVVAVHDGGALATDSIVHDSIEVLAQTEGHKCHRTVSSDYANGNIDKWVKLKVLYRDADVVKVPYFAKFPWHENVAECPQ